MFPLLPAIVLIPLLFIIPLFALNKRHSFRIALASSMIVFLLVASASYIGLTSGFGALSFSHEYLPSLGISLSLQITQYTNVFLVMSAIVLLAAAIVASGFIKESARIYNFLFLLVESSAIGLFLSGSLFMFYVFWELSEIAMFFIIYLFGGFDRRYAAIKFIVYSIVASLSLLIGIMVIYSNVPMHTFDIASIASQSAAIPASAQLMAMLLLVFAFLIKIPVFPFHTWLPDAHTEAPTTGSMVLAGILLKFGTYGLLLMFLLLPISLTYANYLAVLFGFSALYGAIVAIRQTNLKRMIAYTSVVEMGIASIGLASLNVFGTAGALYALLSHGIVISLMFLLAGAIDESFGTLILERIKGVLKELPLAVIFVHVRGIRYSGHAAHRRVHRGPAGILGRIQGVRSLRADSHSRARAIGSVSVLRHGEIVPQRLRCGGALPESQEERLRGRRVPCCGDAAVRDTAVAAALVFRGVGAVSAAPLPLPSLPPHTLSRLSPRARL